MPCGSGVSGQASDGDSSQHPHSTEKEPGQTRRYVTSQLQSLLQQHLQRNTALRSIQQQHQQQRAALSAANPSDSLLTTTSVPQLMPSIVPIMAMPPSMIPMPMAEAQQVGWDVIHHVMVQCNVKECSKAESDGFHGYTTQHHPTPQA